MMIISSEIPNTLWNEVPMANTNNWLNGINIYHPDSSSVVGLFFTTWRRRRFIWLGLKLLIEVGFCESDAKFASNFIASTIQLEKYSHKPSCITPFKN